MVFNSELNSVRFVSTAPLNTALLSMPAVLFSITLFPYCHFSEKRWGPVYCLKTALVTLNSTSMYIVQLV